MSQISEAVRLRVRAQAGDRCGYCRSLQKYVLGILEVYHIISRAVGGCGEVESFYAGLWLDRVALLRGIYSGFWRGCDR
jgi:hypothetical protein